MTISVSTAGLRDKLDRLGQKMEQQVIRNSLRKAGIKLRNKMRQNLAPITSKPTKKSKAAGQMHHLYRSITSKDTYDKATGRTGVLVGLNTRFYYKVLDDGRPAYMRSRKKVHAFDPTTGKKKRYYGNGNQKFQVAATPKFNSPGLKGIKQAYTELKQELIMDIKVEMMKQIQERFKRKG